MAYLQMTDENTAFRYYIDFPRKNQGERHFWDIL